MIKLDDYQKDAVLRMKNGSILCGKVGSGKSRTALAYYYTRGCHGTLKNGVPGPRLEPKDLYIITTARKRDEHEWEDECEPFEIDSKIFIDSWNNIKKYENVSDAFFIFDEQRVVGYGPWVKAFLKISKKNQWILLSATPGDKWIDYMPVFIAHGFYKNKSDFVNRHAVYSMKTKYPKIERYLDTKRLIFYRDSILVNMDYENKTNKHYITLTVPYDQVTYRMIWKNRWDIYQQKPIENVPQLCYTIRKLINSDNRRIDEYYRLTQEHPKVIVFYNFNYELDILESLEYEDGTVVAQWNGKKHEPVPDSDRWVYLVQYASGSEAWNCTKTDTIIFYSLNYSYRTMEQAAGRIDRRNTKFKDLYYYMLRSRSPMDLAIEQCLKRKKKFNENSFVGA